MRFEGVRSIMRAMSALFIVGLTALTSAARAQEPLCNPCLDMPADHQALKPLPTDWPNSPNAINAPSTRYNISASGPVYGRQSLDARRLGDVQRYVEALRRVAAGTAVSVPGASTPANASSASNPGRAGEGSP